MEVIDRIVRRVMGFVVACCYLEVGLLFDQTVGEVFVVIVEVVVRVDQITTMVVALFTHIAIMEVDLIVLTIEEDLA